MLITVDGCVGVGKTRFLDECYKRYDRKFVKVLKEPLAYWKDVRDEHQNNLLELFYNQPNAHAFSFQLTVLMSRALQIVEAMEKYPVVIVERSLHTDRIFAEMAHRFGYISYVEKQVYDNLYDILVPLLPKCCLTLYLRAPANVCMQRVMKRARKEERTVTEQYLDDICKMHDMVLYNDFVCDVLTLNAEPDDFAGTNALSDHFRTLEETVKILKKYIFKNMGVTCKKDREPCAEMWADIMEEKEEEHNVQTASPKPNKENAWFTGRLKLKK